MSRKLNGIIIRVEDIPERLTNVQVAVLRKDLRDRAVVPVFGMMHDKQAMERTVSDSARKYQLYVDRVRTGKDFRDVDYADEYCIGRLDAAKTVFLRGLSGNSTVTVLQLLSNLHELPEELALDRTLYSTDKGVTPFQYENMTHYMLRRGGKNVLKASFTTNNMPKKKTALVVGMFLNIQRGNELPSMRVVLVQRAINKQTLRWDYRYSMVIQGVVEVEAVGLQNFLSAVYQRKNQKG